MFDRLKVTVRFLIGKTFLKKEIIANIIAKKREEVVLS